MARSPRLIERTQRVLGPVTTGDYKANAAIVQRWKAQELEDALAEAGACGAMVRTFDEWAAHPQRDAIAPLAGVAITKSASPTPRRSATACARSAECACSISPRVLAGPTNARVLAEHGADVLHINGAHLDNVDAFVMDTGHGKAVGVARLERRRGRGDAARVGGRR